MGIVTIDGQDIEIADDERLNGIQVAARAGIDVPHYCWHPGLSVVASCRMCLVETGRRNEDGQVSMVPKLVPACQTPATDGTVFVTNSDKVTQARAMVEEDLLIRHPIDCPICDKAGECHLQDYHFQHGREERRADLKPFTSRRRPLGDTVTLFVDRCVMCSRCVRFCREVSGTSELMVANRGAHEEIDVFPGFPLHNKLSGNVVDLCPVGALGDRDFLYSQRVWFMKSHDSVCAGCSTGCSIHVEENQDQIYRLKPRANPHVNQWWMCDEGRYGWKHVHSDARVSQPRRRVKEPTDLEADDPSESVTRLDNVEWPQMIELLDESLAAGRRLGGVLSPHLTVEEAFLFTQFLRSRDPQALIAVGPIPVQGEDDHYGSFTIHAEKCPNRRGVEAVAAAANDGTLLDWDGFLERLESETLDAVWVTGGYKSDWNDESTAGRFDGVGTLIVQDLFSSPLWERADLQVPGAAFAEREGSVVNFADRLQTFEWAIRPPAGVQPEGWLLWRLSRRVGLYDAATVREELARQIGYFAPVAGAPVPPVGVDLKVMSLA